MDTLKYASAYAKFYETLSPATTLEEYGVFFDSHSKFSDPFQSVVGLRAIHNIFVDMYAKLHEPHFVVDEIVASSDVAYLKWRFVFALESHKEPQSFCGLSRVVFSPSAKVKSHEDFWDAASNVYEKIPLLGSLLRFIKRKLHAK